MGTIHELALRSDGWVTIHIAFVSPLVALHPGYVVEWFMNTFR